MSRRCAVLGLLCLLRLLRFTARFSAQSAKHRINPQLQHGCVCAAASCLKRPASPRLPTCAGTCGGASSGRLPWRWSPTTCMWTSAGRASCQVSFGCWYRWHLLCTHVLVVAHQPHKLCGTHVPAGPPLMPYNPAGRSPCAVLPAIAPTAGRVEERYLINAGGQLEVHSVMEARGGCPCAGVLGVGWNGRPALGNWCTSDVLTVASDRHATGSLFLSFPGWSEASA